jgi:ribosomal protein L37AE/L43A
LLHRKTADRLEEQPEPNLEREKRTSIRSKARSIDGPGTAPFVEFQVLYRILRWITTWYPLAVLWLCIVAMIVAFSLMFVFPPGTLLLLFLGLAGLGSAVLGFRALQAMQRGVARRSMAHGICPSCKAKQQWPATGETWHCTACGTVLLASGAEDPEQEHQEAAAEHSTTSRI